MSNVIKSMEERLGARLTKRVADTRSGRPDFYLADWEVVDDHSAKVLIGYNKRFGAPRASQVDQWVSSTFEGQMRLALESVRGHAYMEAVSGVLVRQPELLPARYSDRMIPVHASEQGIKRFADDAHRIWEAMTDDSGNPFLVRIARDDVAAILEARQRRFKQGFAHHRPRLSDLRQAGVLDYEVGDTVTYLDGGVRQFGEVQHVGADNVRVATNGQTTVVPRGHVVDIVQKSLAATRRSQQEYIDIWTKMYGDKDFARKLVTLKNTGNE